MNRRWIACGAAALLSLGPLAACGDDEDDDASETTEAGSGSGGSDGDVPAELCELAEELAAQEDVPSGAQIARYAELAPEELQADLEVVGPAVEEHEGDLVGTLAAIAEDDVSDAIAHLDEFETAECGVEHDPAENPPSVDVDPDANRVDVVGTEYAFALPAAIPSGPTSFVLTSEGDEAHFMLIAQLVDGHTVEEVLAFEGDPLEAGMVTELELTSAAAAPGGDDEEVINADLEPGEYAMACFLPGPDGTPHAFSGMATGFTVE